jgi:RHS repeat-associated protein
MLRHLVRRRVHPEGVSPVSRRWTSGSEGTRNIILLIALVFGGFPLRVAAQQPDETLPGFKPNNIYDSNGIDNVNLFSGDPGIVIPIGPEYVLGPGYSWQLKAYNTCKLWSFATCPTVPSIRQARLSGAPTLGLGWRLELGYVTGGTASPGNPVYTSPDGSSRPLNLSTGGITDDGTHLRATSHSCPGGYCYTIEFPDGTKQIFDHAYIPARPISGSSPSPDFDGGFWTASTFNLNNFVRAGLTSIVDSFGSTLLTVDYMSSCSSTPCQSTNNTAWQIRQINLYGDGGRAIVFSWTQATVSGIMWNVLSQLTFPSASASVQPLKVQFSFDTVSSISRNLYDQSSGTSCARGDYVYVPFLTAIDFQNSATTPATTLARYGFNYHRGQGFSDPSRDGGLTDITLPTGGTIHYDYGTTADSCTDTGCPDPESASGSPLSAPQAPSPPAYLDQVYLDDSPAVYQRTETESAGHVRTVSYNRMNFFQFRSGTTVDLDAILRRTLVTESVGIASNLDDSAIRITNYIFHVAKPGESPTPKGTSGIELERRHFQDASGTGSPVRSKVFCWEAGISSGAGTCGAKDPIYARYQPYGFSGNVRRYAEVTWYGANPLGGGTCPYQSSVFCKITSSSEYNPSAGKYRTTAWRSSTERDDVNLRTSMTDWDPQTVSVWLLNLFTRRFDTDISGTSVERFTYFDDANGFLKGDILWDPSGPSPGRIFPTCQYQNSGAPDGTVRNRVTFVVDGFSRPSTGNPCYDSITFFSSIGSPTNNDLFATQSAYQNGKLTTSYWMRSPNDNSPLWYKTNLQRESATGWVTASFDTAGVSTTYTYDAVGRITSIVPSGETATSISYDPTNLKTTLTRSGGASQTYIYDHLGRLTREIRQMAAGYATRTHAFDSAGHQYFDSEWTGCTNLTGDCLSATAPGTTRSNFDPFGRPQSQVGADGSTTTISYTDGAILFSDKKKTVTVKNVNGTCGVGACSSGSDAATVYAYDIFDRLTSVTDAPGKLTTYTYDVNDKLTSVSQLPDQPSTSRNFTYDPAGFLRSETTPEKGTVTYADGSAGLAYGSLGNVILETQPGGVVVSRTYDFAGRVKMLSAGGSTYAMNLYDGNGFAGGTSPLGKLTQRIGYNLLSNVTENFTYSGLGGRLSQRDWTLSSTPLSLGTVSETWSYNLLGLVSSHTLPKRSIDSAMTAIPQYSNGIPIGLSVTGGPTLVGSVTYRPHGGLATWQAANGIMTTIGADPSLLPRPSSISTSSGGFNTGAYSYDGAGNITKMDPDTFTYDGLSRLTVSTVSGQQLSYPYDRYGNLNYTPVDAATNRLTAGTYDARGNLTSLGSQRYDYDFLSRQTMLNGGYERYLYDGDEERIARITGSTAGSSFFTITPCRVLDTRNPPPNPPVPLDPANPRVVQMTGGSCGIPPDAVAVAGNLTVVTPPGAGVLSLYPAGASSNASTLNYKTGGSRANNFSLGLSGGGQLALSASPDPTHAVIDVSGYYTFPAVTWSLSFRDESNRISTDYTVTSSSISRAKNYFYFGNLLVATRDVSGNYLYYASDHLGTPRLVTNASGVVVETHKYQPFGQEIGGLFGNQPLKFASMERDASSGKDYDHARFLSPLDGRFLSPDKVQGQIEDPQAWNRYAYAGNNPLKYVDPNGKQSVSAQAFANVVTNLAERIDVVNATIHDQPILSGVSGGLRAVAGMLSLGSQTGELTEIGSYREIMDSVINESVTAAAMVEGMWSLGRAATSLEVQHFTSSATADLITQRGELNAGTYVTKPADVRGLAPAQVEQRLGIDPGRGSVSFTLRVPRNMLVVPTAGPQTVGRAYQRQLKVPCSIESNCKATPQ